MISVLHRPERRCALVQRIIPFFWEPVANATSYVLQVGTATGQSDVYNDDVGNMIVYELLLGAGTYFGRVIPYIDAEAQAETDEQVVTI